MVTFAQMLRQRALQFANDSQQRSNSTKKRLAELEMEKLELEAQLVAAKDSYARVKTFQPVADGGPQCPACIVRNGRQIAMVRTGSSSHHRWFRCPNCNNEEVEEI